MNEYNKNSIVDGLSKEQMELFVNSQHDLLTFYLEQNTVFDAHLIRLTLELGQIEAKRRLELLYKAEMTAAAALNAAQAAYRAAGAALNAAEAAYRAARTAYWDAANAAPFLNAADTTLNDVDSNLNVALNDVRAADAAYRAARAAYWAALANQEKRTTQNLRTAKE